MHFEDIHEFVSEDWRIWVQRLGAEASAGAIADMYENHDAVRITGRLFGTILVKLAELNTGKRNSD